MELQLEGETVAVLGPGDELDRVLLRVLADEGAATYATQTGRSTSQLRQPGGRVPHWVTQEEHLNEATAGRVLSFLDDQGRTPQAVVVHLDMARAFDARGHVPWWRFRSELKAITRTTVDIALAAVPEGRRSRLVLLHQLTEPDEYPLAVRWMRRASATVIKRAPDTVRVNSVLAGPGSDLAQVAALTAMFCSPLAARVSGALIPVDDGAYAHDTAVNEEDDD